MTTHRVTFFGSGPSQIPLTVLQETQRDLLNIRNCGQSVLEISHRGGVFDDIIKETEEDLRKILSIPKNYKVVFLQGGATGQFAAVPLNLLGKTGINPDYLVTGRWSQVALEEAKIFTNPQIVCNGNGKHIPLKSTWNLNPKAPYLFYCDNETAHGVEFSSFPEAPEGVPLVVDMSSNFLTRPIDVSKYGAIFAGAQKNCGTAGLTILIVREDLLTLPKPYPTPTILDWKKNSDQNSCLNTPPVMPIYLAGLVFKWILKEGGLQVMEERCKLKSKLLYDVIDQSNGYYEAPVEIEFRSRVNIVFTIHPETLQPKFLEEAGARHLFGLAGHKAVGGIRASLYNAITVEETQKLVMFMVEFQRNNSK